MAGSLKRIDVAEKKILSSLGNHALNKRLTSDRQLDILVHTVIDLNTT
jgi:hypothetical protein